MECITCHDEADDAGVLRAQIPLVPEKESIEPLEGALVSSVRRHHSHPREGEGERGRGRKRAREGERG